MAMDPHEFVSFFIVFISSILTYVTPDLDHSYWNGKIREEVQFINDPTCDITMAFELMDQQDNRCSGCQCQFNKITNPVLVKSKIEHTFLKMKSTEIDFTWICSICSNKEQEQTRIENLIKEEEELEQMRISLN